MEQYEQTIRRRGVWGGHVELQALADEYRVVVEIYDSHSHSLLTIIHGDGVASSPRALRLEYTDMAGVSETHFIYTTDLS